MARFCASQRCACTIVFCTSDFSSHNDHRRSWVSFPQRVSMLVREESEVVKTNQVHSAHHITRSLNIQPFPNAIDREQFERQHLNNSSMTPLLIAPISNHTNNAPYCTKYAHSSFRAFQKPLEDHLPARARTNGQPTKQRFYFRYETKTGCPLARKVKHLVTCTFGLGPS